RPTACWNPANTRGAASQPTHAAARNAPAKIKSRILSSSRCSTRASPSSSSIATSWPSGPARAPAASASGSLTGFSGAGLVLRGAFCASRSILIVLEPDLGPLKLADAEADGFAHLRELSRPEDDQGQHQDDDELSRADVSKHALYSFQPARDRRPVRTSGSERRPRSGGASP